MNQQEAKEWKWVDYPATIINDRYSGTYSGASWTAFPLDPCDIPEEIYDEDIPCMNFWDKYKEPVGKGSTPDEAMADLIAQIREIANNPDTK